MKKTLLTNLFIFLVLSGYSQNLSISGGFAYSLSVCTSGKVFAWGDNREGQIGQEEVSPGVFTDRTAEFYDTPQALAGFPEIVQVDAGSGGHAIGLTCNNQVVTWGANCKGQLGGGNSLLGTNSCSVPSIESIREPVFVVGIDGVGTLNNVTDISGGTASSYAVLADGKVASWGTNAKDELGRTTVGTWSSTPGYVLDNEDNPITDIISVEGTDFGAYALSSTGQIYSWGENISNSLGRSVTTANPENRASLIVDATSSALQDIIMISGGATHGLAIDKNNNVWAWGGDWAGQIGNGEPFHNDDFAVRVLGGESEETFLGDNDPIIKIAAGQRNSAAVTISGKLYVWGSPSNGVSTGCYKGTTYDINTAQGSNSNPETTPVLMDISNVHDVSNGSSWFFAIKKDGSTWVEGGNERGQQGIGGTTNTCGWEELIIPDCNLSYACPNPTLEDIQVCYEDNLTLSAGTIPPGFTATWTKSDNSTVIQKNSITASGFLDVELIISNFSEQNLGTYSLMIEDLRPATNRACLPCNEVNETSTITAYESTGNSALFEGTSNLEYLPGDSCAQVSLESSTTTPLAGKFGWYANQVGGDTIVSSIDEEEACFPGIELADPSGTSPDQIWQVWAEDISFFKGQVRNDSQDNPRTNFSSGSFKSKDFMYDFSSLYFDALIDFRINSMEVEYSCFNSSEFIMTVYNSNGDTLAQSTTTIDQSTCDGSSNLIKTSPFLDVKDLDGDNDYLEVANIPAGNDHRLSMYTGGSMMFVWWYENGPTNWYPYTYNLNEIDMVRFTGTGMSDSQYPWSTPSYFNWEIETGNYSPCPIGKGARVGVEISEKLPVGTNDPFENQSLTVHPNPVLGNLQFSKEIQNGTIYNLLGVKINSFKNSTSYDCSELSEGLYIIDSEHGKIQFQVIK